MPIILSPGQALLVLIDRYRNKINELKYENAPPDSPSGYFTPSDWNHLPVRSRETSVDSLPSLKAASETRTNSPSSTASETSSPSVSMAVISTGSTDNRALDVGPEIKALEDVLNKLKKNYLSGKMPQGDSAAKEFHELLEMGRASGFLEGYQISEDYTVINEDASRRYFETHLAYETLIENIGELDVKSLHGHYNTILSVLPLNYRISFEELFKNQDKKNEFYDIEIMDAYKKILSTDIYKEFSAADKEKLLLIIKIWFISRELEFYIVDLRKSNHSIKRLPLSSIYGDGFYAEEQRGRIMKGEQRNGKQPSSQAALADDKKLKLLRNQKTVLSSSLGIMRSYMPVPKNDAANAEVSSPYLRVADINTFKADAAWVKKNFDGLVHPYSSSISGVMLLQFKVMKFMDDQKRLIFNDTERLANYVKCFTSLLLYSSGGHSYNEFLFVLTLPDIQRAFKFIPDFKKLTQGYLLKETNERAFETALTNAIAYNKTILAKKAFHEAMKNQFVHTLFQPSDVIISECLKEINKKCRWLDKKGWYITSLPNNEFECRVQMDSKTETDELTKTINSILQVMHSPIKAQTVLTESGMVFLELHGVTPQALKSLLKSEPAMKQLSAIHSANDALQEKKLH